MDTSDWSDVECGLCAGARATPSCNYPCPGCGALVDGKVILPRQLVSETHGKSLREALLLSSQVVLGSFYEAAVRWEEAGKEARRLGREQIEINKEMRQLDLEARRIDELIEKAGRGATGLCGDCGLLLEDGHSCKPDDVKSYALIVSKCTPCPRCHTMIARTEGCSQMFCTNCFQKFSSTTGKPIGVTSRFENPHHNEWQANRQGGSLAQDLARTSRVMQHLMAFTRETAQRGEFPHLKPLQPQLRNINRAFLAGEISEEVAAKKMERATALASRASEESELYALATVELTRLAIKVVMEDDPVDTILFAEVFEGVQKKGNAIRTKYGMPQRPVDGFHLPPHFV